MISFIGGVLLLILGYLTYGRLVDRVFVPDGNRTTPAYEMRDDVDFLPMPTWKVALIQFLNIAGTGPIFGAVLGIMFGPAAYLWIVLGCIFAGAVHDFFSGMVSVRSGGLNIPEIVGNELGTASRYFMRVVSLVLLISAGAMFSRTPADMLASLTQAEGFWGGSLFWLIVIIVYYILATLLPIDKLIGKIYPVFGAALLIMAVCVCYGIFFEEGSVPEVTDAFVNHYPGKAVPIFPCISITIACGAVSGFHATQSPLMARCINNERHGRLVFYGAMILEGLVALIWAAGAVKFADSLNVAGDSPYEKLLVVMTENGKHSANPAILVNELCSSWFGMAGTVLAVLGVVAAPITSGDTAFRSARLIASEFTHIRQDSFLVRLATALPLFAIAIFLFFVDFQVVWRYNAWLNQTLASFALWAFVVWCAKRKMNFLIVLVPAVFLTFVTSSYICVAREGFQLPETVAYCIGGVVTVALTVLFFVWRSRLEIPEKPVYYHESH